MHRLRELREQRGWSQDKVAKEIGATRITISRYEAGLRQPDYEVLKKLANLFFVTTDYLIGNSDDSTPPAQKKEAPSISFEEMEQAYVKMLAEEEGVSVKNLVLSEDRRKQLRRVILSLLEG